MQVQIPDWREKKSSEEDQNPHSDKNSDNIWEMKEEESAKHYDLFQCYRDMGRNRTLKDMSKEVDTSHSHLKNLSRRYNWRDRVEAWKKHESVMETKSKEEALKETYEVLYKNAPSLMKTAIEMAEDGESTRMLKFLLEKIMDGNAQKHIHELKKKDDEDVEDVLERAFRESID